MTERYRKIKTAENETFWKQDLHDVINNPTTESQIADIRTSRSDEVPGLTLAFAPKRSYLKREASVNNGNGHLQFGGVEGLFGLGYCVGVKVVEEGGEDKAYEDAHRSLQSAEYGIPLNSNAEVAIVHPEDIPLWKRFYQHIEKERLVKKAGARVFSASGLDRQDRKTYESQIFNLQSILAANAGYLEKSGVVRKAPNSEMGLDLAFISKDDYIVGVPLAHVKTASLMGGILVEKILDKKILCPGFIIRRPWETKREAYERAEKARLRFVEQYKEKAIAVPVVSAGQNSLWNKLGFSHELKNQEPQTKIKVEELIKFLYLGEDNLHPGPFSRQGLSLPPKLREDLGINIDVVLYLRNRGDMNFQFATIDGIYGYQKKGWNSKYELGKVDNVGGIIIVPEGWMENKQILEKIETSKNALKRYLQHSKDVNIIPLDASLFAAWVEAGKPFVKKGQISLKKPDSSFGSKRILKDEDAAKDGTFLGIFQQGTQIGGMQMALAQRKNGDTGYNIIDMGGVYAYTPQAYQEITARPTTASGLKIELELQGSLMVPGILYPEYILQTAVGLSHSLSHAENVGPVASYIRSELVHRFTFSELKDVLGAKKARDILQLGKVDEAIWYSKGNHHLSSVTISHAHDDHDRGLFALDDASFIMRRQTLALLKAKTERAGTWRQRLLDLTLIQHPKERGAFQRIPRNVIPIDFNSQQVSLGGNILENLFLVGHSLPGTGAPFLSSRNGSFKSVLYTADIRPDPFGHTQEMVNMVAGKADIIVAESTNPAITNKASVGVTESEVKASFSKLLKSNEKKPVIILTPWHNIERMNSIFEVAAESGRKVALGYDHWEAFIQMAAEQLISPQGAEGFDFSYPTIGEDAALWPRFSTKPLRYQDTLSGMASWGKLGILTNKQLQEEAGEWIIVTAPSRLLMKDFNGGFWPRGMVVAYSSPYPYAMNQKTMAAANKMWVEQNKGTFAADFEVYGNGGRVKPLASKYGALTASGHGTYDQNVSLIADLLDGRYKGKEVVVVHGEHSQSYGQMMQQDIARKLGLNNPNELKITGKLNTYNPKNPLKYKGHWIKLD